MRAATALMALLLVTLVLAACAGGPGASSAPTLEPATPPTATPTAPPTGGPTTAPSPTGVVSTVYTPDDEEIAKLIRAISADATEQLVALADMSLDEQLPVLLEVPTWVNDRKAELDEFTPSSCTQDAVLVFFRGMDRYADVAEKFLAWREWGVLGDPYPRNMPLQAVAFLEDALEELEASCPT